MRVRAAERVQEGVRALRTGVRIARAPLDCTTGLTVDYRVCVLPSVVEKSARSLIA